MDLYRVWQAKMTHKGDLDGFGSFNASKSSSCSGVGMYPTAMTANSRKRLVLSKTSCIALSSYLHLRTSAHICAHLRFGFS